MVLPDEQIVIVGAGCFGISTAYHLFQRGFTDVTVLDRSPTLPAPDAASNDFNRIVRSSYSDRFYTKLAREAIRSWKKVEEWGDSYHESGVLVLGCAEEPVQVGSAPIARNSSTPNPSQSPTIPVPADEPGQIPTSRTTYTDQSYANDLELGANLVRLESLEAIRGSAFPPGVRIGSSHVRGSLDNNVDGGTVSVNSGYLNHDGGWANAGKGLNLLTNRVVDLGGKLFPGCNVVDLVIGQRNEEEQPKIVGVKCADGAVFNAAVVIIATGSWTPSAFPGLELNKCCLATGQCIGMIQLTASEAELYKACPVVLDFRSGFYIFPPNEENVVKMAIHSKGYTHTIGAVSTPRTVTSDPQGGLRIPKVALKALRNNLRELYPDLAGKPFISTRLCWYNDSPDGDWIIGPHPKYAGIFMATAGSGHAYKFLPVIGRLVADSIQACMEPGLARKFAVDREHMHGDLSRAPSIAETRDGPEELNLDELCTIEDLQGDSSIKVNIPEHFLIPDIR
ncbi:FAD dependent oxidoreductase [Pluteus cervinus]|uniref:FAD dependent oxidoreductase n=1 Tax=Pluteus cervinus TaxID=181527 RepID=A0ACD3B8P7_9AGAR|nr:FAD dependent oxidoreductase [Pluteus cervinus]